MHKVALLVLLAGAPAMADVTVSRLRCEYLTDPLAIDAEQPRLSWILESSHRATTQTAYQVLAASSEAALAADKADLWDSGRVASDATAQVPYAGKPLTSGQDVFWKVRVWTNPGDASTWSPVARWRMGLLRPADVRGQWIGSLRNGPPEERLPALPAAMLRKTFALDRPIRRAYVTASALGVYELRINGQRVGDHILAPEWTNYHKRVQYQVYDVAPLLRRGDNAIGAMLGDGWYAGRIGISHIVEDGPLRGHYGRQPRLFVQLDVEHDDGSHTTVLSDGTWKTTTDGPIRKACILDGEVYDARKEMNGWDAPGFDDASWHPANAVARIDAALVAQPNDPIRVTEELQPARITEPSPGVYVVDFGQILAGWCRIGVKGPAGTAVRLRHAEVLEPDGNIYRDNLRMKPLGGDLGARQEDVFTLRGTGDTETFEPHFTYHGFRYVEVAGLPRRDALLSITARAFHSDTPRAGSFECSSPLLNQLMRNIVWTHRDNMHGIPTDCPQRDERMGWTGDMFVFSQPACFNMDMAAFFTKWQHDLAESQADDGRVGDVAPHPYDPNVRFSGAPAWADCVVIVPWRMYVNYGDTRIIREHFESMRRWVDFVHKQNPDLLWKNARGNDYGDWLNGDTLKLDGYPKGGAQVPKEVFSTAYFQHSARRLADMAAAIGRTDDATRYAKLAADVRAAFIRAYVKDDGRIEGDTQSTYALALAYDLVPPDQRAAALRHMIERIDAYKGHISTGFHTTILLMNELTRAGRSDVAYRLINNRTIPSWGYTIDHGATTIWERWDGYVEGRGYQDPGMNSFCHYAIGAVGEWMYRTIIGINPDAHFPGYGRFSIRPQPGGGLTWARGAYDSIHGRIASEWSVNDNELSLAVTVPANTTAEVYVPAPSADAVREGDRPAGTAQGVRLARMQDGAAIFEVGSGTYRFRVRASAP